MTEVIQTVPEVTLPLSARRALGDAAAGIPSEAFAGATVSGKTAVRKAAVTNSDVPEGTVTKPEPLQGSGHRPDIDANVDNMGECRYGSG